MKTIEQIKNAAEHNYKVVMAAVKVYEANSIYEAAEEKFRGIKFDPTHATSNEGWLHAYEERNRAEGNVKKAVNQFLKSVGEEPKKWELAIQAIDSFKGYIRESGWLFKEKPLIEISLYDIVCNLYE